MRYEYMHEYMRNPNRTLGWVGGGENSGGGVRTSGGGVDN